MMYSIAIFNICIKKKLINKEVFLIMKGLLLTRDGMEIVLKEIEVSEGKNQLEDMQNYIGGYIEIPYIKKIFNDNEILVILNEEGKLLDLEPTCILKKDEQIYDTFNGNVLFLSAEGENIIGLNKKQINIIKNEIQLVSDFVIKNNENIITLATLELD